MNDEELEGLYIITEDVSISVVRQDAPEMLIEQLGIVVVRNQPLSDKHRENGTRDVAEARWRVVPASDSAPEITYLAVNCRTRAAVLHHV